MAKRSKGDDDAEEGPRRKKGRLRDRRASAAAQKKPSRMRLWTAVWVIVMTVVAAVVYVTILAPGGGGPPPNGGDPNPIATLSTSQGIIKIELLVDKAPVTAAVFIEHVRQGNYNDTTFHRIIRANGAPVRIQGGDMRPKGLTPPQIPWEDTGLRNLDMMVAMDRLGDLNDFDQAKNARSEFFINTADNPRYDKVGPGNPNGVEYPLVVFGKVVDGQLIVRGINALSPFGLDDYDGPPTEEVRIFGITVRE